MIKRTFYRESIITGTGVEMPELEKMLDTQSTSISHSASGSKLTTRVTVNLRNFKRRSSDFGLKANQDEANRSPRMTDTRHSISGNDMPFLNTLRGEEAAVATTSGRSLEQFLNGPGGMRAVSCTCVPGAISQQSINCNSTELLLKSRDRVASFRRVNVSKVGLGFITLSFGQFDETQSN